jgi:fatty-acyl-CoA synthase
VSSRRLPAAAVLPTLIGMYVSRLLRALEPGRAVLHWPGGSLTGSNLRERILGSAAALAAAGAGPGSLVGILTEPNEPAMLWTRYAAHHLGAAVTHVRSMNARSDREHLPLAEQARILRGTGSRLLVVDGRNRDRGRQLAEAVPGVVLVDADARGPGKTPPAPYRPGELAVVDLTSGSTNAPKLVRVSFGAREARVRHSEGDHAPGRPLTLLCVTPVSQSTATMVDSVLLGGGVVVLHPDFDADRVLDAVAGQRITDVYLAVPHLYRLLDHPRLAATDLSSLRQVLYTGTAAAPARIAAAAAVFGGALTQLYGSTEAGGICALTPLDHQEPELLGAVGRPFSWVTVEVRDAAGTPVPRGGTGELWVRSDTLMTGYVDGPKVPRDGWLRTGDLAFQDPYGYFHLVGRTANVIKTNGLHVHLAEIERTLLTHPAVANAAVFAVRDHEYAQHAHAAVELRSDCPVEALRAHVAERLSPAHVPARITPWPRLPLLASGKPDQLRLRQESVAVTQTGA